MLVYHKCNTCVLHNSQTKLNWCPGSKMSIFHEMTLTITLILKLDSDMVKIYHHTNDIMNGVMCLIWLICQMSRVVKLNLLVYQWCWSRKNRARHLVANNRNIQLLNCVTEHGLTLKVMTFFTQCLLLVKSWPVLVVATRSMTWILWNIVIWHNDIKPSPDEFAKWQHLLGGIPSWRNVT